MLLIRRVTLQPMASNPIGPQRSREPAHWKESHNSNCEGVIPPDGAVCIDGSQLEGGGQILRNSVALAAITGKAIYVDKIRAGRKNPGLSPQHLTGLKLVESISHGVLQGGAPRSTVISFAPGRAAAGAYTADTKTAGSCTLMVQQALPCLMFARQPEESTTSILTLRGGTDANFAPPIGYLQHVLLPLLQQQLGQAGNSLKLALVRRGFYPKGGGEAVLQVSSLSPGQALPALRLSERGYVTRIDGYAFTAGNVRPDIGRRIARSATADIKQALKNPSMVYGSHALANRAGHVSTAQPAAAGDAPQKLQTDESSSSSTAIPNVVVDIQAVEEPADRAFSHGGGITLVAETSTGCLLGATALVERGVTAEAVGSMAARDLIEALQSGAAVDDWMQDQLVIFMALAEGTSCLLSNEPTLHTRTAIAVVQQLLPQVQFTINIKASAATAATAAQPLYLIQCKGAAMVT